MKTFLIKLCTPNGRRTRVELLQGYLFLSFLILAIFGLMGLTQNTFPQIQILWLTFIPLGLSLWFICVQRLHDCNKSGIWMLLKFVPFLNLCLFLYICFMPGTESENQFDLK